MQYQLIFKIMGGSIASIIIVYLFFRLASSAVFRSYYEMKEKMKGKIKKNNTK